MIAQPNPPRLNRTVHISAAMEIALRRFGITLTDEERASIARKQKENRTREPKIQRRG